MKNWSKLIPSVAVIAVLALAVLGITGLAGENPVKEAGQWSDTTDVLSNLAAAQAGRETREPFINTEQGNMLVFFFGLGGIISGFAIGYNWRRLLAEPVGEVSK